MKKISMIMMLCLASMLLLAETVTLYPSDDMYTDVENTGANPVTTQLWTANFTSTNHFERIMMQFDLSEYEGRTIESASLHLTRLYSCPSGGTTGTKFYAIDTAWNENTWNIRQHISYHQDKMMPYVFSGTGGNAIVHFQVDIKDFVQEWMSGEIENHGFVIIANSNQKFSKFYSKEFANEAYRPHLEIVLSPLANDDVYALKPVNYIKNYPNPFNPSTTIEYDLAKNSNISVEVYNAKGQRVKTLVNAYMQAGKHSLVWNGADDNCQTVSTGIYYCKIKCNNSVQFQKMMMIK